SATTETSTAMPKRIPAAASGKPPDPPATSTGLPSGSFLALDNFPFVPIAPSSGGPGPGRRSRLADHVLQQVDAAVGVAPFVVVPRDELEEPAVQLDPAAGVEDARSRVVDEVGGNHVVVGVLQDALEVRLGGPLHRGADLLVTRRLHGPHGQ